MGSTSVWGTRRTMVFLMQVVAVTAFILFINLPMQAQGAVDTDHPVVIDAEGNPVVVGEEYYVVPAVSGNGGGLTLKMRVNSSCPMYVVQENSETSWGLPVVFRVAASQRGVNYSAVSVQEHVNLDVNTAALTVCVQSTAWSAENDANTTKRFIKASNTTSLFQIVKAIDGDGYVLYFCPCNCRLVCTKLGIYVDDHDNSWLVVDNSAEALRVQFRKND